MSALLFIIAGFLFVLYTFGVHFSHVSMLGLGLVFVAVGLAFAYAGSFASWRNRP
jgi:hypothetical protein